MNCPSCNNNMYSASLDCQDGALMIQYISGSNSYNNDTMHDWINDSDWCLRIHNDNSNFEWCNECSILTGNS